MNEIDWFYEVWFTKIATDPSIPNNSALKEKNIFEVLQWRKGEKPVMWNKQKNYCL